MLPMRPARIFRSRWRALLWAAGVIWTTVTVVGFAAPARPDGKQPEETAITDATGSPVSNADLAVLKDFMNR